MNQIPKQYVNNYEGLIKNRAALFHKKYGGEFEDLLQEGFSILCYSFHKFNPKKQTAFSTFLYINLNYHLREYTLKNRVNYNKEIDIIDESGLDYAFNIELNDLISKLSAEAKEIISIIFKAPTEMMELAPRFSGEIWKRKITRKLLIKYFTEIKNWTYAKCFNAFSEIKIALEIN